MVDTPESCGKCGTSCQEYLCLDCVRVAKDDLRRMRWLLGELEITLTRQANTAPGEFVGGKSADKPLPWAEKASNAINLLQSCVCVWSGALGPVADETLLEGNTLELILWMRRNADALPRLETAPRCANALQSVVEYCIEAIDLPKIKTSFEVGPCPEGDDSEPCTGVVKAFIPLDEDKSGWMRCDDCKRRWETEEWLAVCPNIARRSGVSRLSEGLVDRAALRLMSGRSQMLITNHCTPVACDVKSEKLLYRIEDVKMLQEIPRRGANHKKAS